MGKKEREKNISTSYNPYRCTPAKAIYLCRPLILCLNTLKIDRLKDVLLQHNNHVNIVCNRMLSYNHLSISTFQISL
jgi:hypothetical protein